MVSQPRTVEHKLRLDRRAQVRGLYVIVDPLALKNSGPGTSPLEVARQAIEGGARVIQLRDKRDKGHVLPLAQALAEVCKETHVLFIVNDHVDIALLAFADGVHLGQQDLPIADARRLLPDEMIVGVSTANLEEALQAQAEGADYVAVGAIYPTTSKENTRPAGLATLRRVHELMDTTPIVAIGGINEKNIAAVRSAGADAAAVISAVVGAADVRSAAERLASAFA